MRTNGYHENKKGGISISGTVKRVNGVLWGCYDLISWLDKRMHGWVPIIWTAGCWSCTLTIRLLGMGEGWMDDRSSKGGLIKASFCSFY